MISATMMSNTPMTIMPPRLLTRRVGSGFGFRSMPDGPPEGVGLTKRCGFGPGVAPVGFRSSAILVTSHNRDRARDRLLSRDFDLLLMLAYTQEQCAAIK